MEKDPEQAAEVERIVDEVRDYLREHREQRSSPRGRRAEIDQAIGRKVGYCSILLRESPPPGRQRRTLAVRDVVALLLELGIDPRRIMPGFFGFDLELYLLKLQEQNKTQIRWVKKQRRRARPLQASLEELAAIAEEMEQLRLSDPPAGKAKGFAALATLDQIEESEERAQVECEIWGALAGLQRMTATFSSGAYCLLLGLEVARRWGMVECEAKLLRRCGYLVGDQGDYEEAVECADRALAIYMRLRDRCGSGQALLDSGIMCRRMGNYNAAIVALEISLDFLPEEAWFERICVFQSRALTYLEDSDVKNAVASLKRLEELAPEPSSEYLTSTVLHLKGEIALKLRKYDRAEEYFREIHSLVAGGPNIPQLAYMSIRLAHILLLRGKLGDLKDLAREMLSLPSRFRHNKILDAALGEFLVAAIAGRLNAQAINGIYDRIGGGFPRIEAPVESSGFLTEPG